MKTYVIKSARDDISFIPSGSYVYCAAYGSGFIKRDDMNETTLEQLVDKSQGTIFSSTDPVSYIINVDQGIKLKNAPKGSNGYKETLLNITLPCGFTNVEVEYEINKTKTEATGITKIYTDRSNITHMFGSDMYNKAKTFKGDIIPYNVDAAKKDLATIGFNKGVAETADSININSSGICSLSSATETTTLVVSSRGAELVVDETLVGFTEPIIKTIKIK